MLTLATMGVLGQNIVHLRELAGFKTQRSFAQALGVEQPQLSDWENERYKPDLSTLIRIAKVLKVSLDSIVAGVDPAYDVIVRDLSGQGAGADSTPQPGGVDAHGKAAARVRELEEDIRIYRTILKKVGDLGTEIATTAAVHRKGAAVAGGKSARGSHP